LFRPTPNNSNINLNGGKLPKISDFRYCYQSAATTSSKLDGVKYIIPLPGVKKGEIKLVVCDGKELVIAHSGSSFVPAFKVSEDVSKLDWENLSLLLEDGLLIVSVPALAKKVPVTEKEFKVK